MKTIKDTCYKGTRILLGNEKRDLIDSMIKILRSEGFVEISIPIIQYSELFSGKVGEENNNMMFNLTDRASRGLCLAPEYTAVIQALSTSALKMERDCRVFYIQECFRGEKPQAGRYRQFTQLGVEIINPTTDWSDYALALAEKLILPYRTDITINTNVRRGLDYYQDGMGFEITCENLGSSKQVCGGGVYDGGIGFAIGIDRILTNIPQPNPGFKL